MAETSPFVTVGFLLTTLATLWLFFKASKNKKLLWGILVWMIIVGALGLTNFYRDVDAFPPRFTFLIGPVFLFVILTLVTKKGKELLDTLDMKWLTLLHTVRIPVEIVLYYIYLAGLIPDLMTFEGYNPDIISGITAPILFYLVHLKKVWGNRALMLWNVICLGLLFNILTIALLSAPTPFQKLTFEQPNIGVTYFPFVWLPAVIVPIVLVSHLASIRQLLSLRKKAATAV